MANIRTALKWENGVAAPLMGKMLHSLRILINYFDCFYKIKTLLVVFSACTAAFVKSVWKCNTCSWLGYLSTIIKRINSTSRWTEKTTNGVSRDQVKRTQRLRYEPLFVVPSTRYLSYRTKIERAFEKLWKKLLPASNSAEADSSGRWSSQLQHVGWGHFPRTKETKQQNRTCVEIHRVSWTINQEHVYAMEFRYTR